MIASLLRRIDWQLVLPVVILLFMSLITLFSVSPSFFRAQLIYSILSVSVFLFFSQVDLGFFIYYKKFIYFGALVAFLFLLFLGLESRGAVRWLDIAGFRIQFSEIFKPFLALVLAGFLVEKKDISFKTFALVLAGVLPIAFLIFRQPDLGSALIYLLSTLVVLAVYGFPLWWYAIGAGGILASIPLLWKFLHEYQRQRVLTFLHLQNDPLGTSYNAIQAIIAVGSGMFFGKGLGQGTQSTLRFLPEKHTDFIFATLSEDLGFIGGAIVILASIFLLYRLFIIMQETEEPFYKIFTLVAFSLLLVQFFINIGMNIGLLPIVGVPLPFVSYGGSSLLANAILLGILSGIGTSIKKKHVLEIR